MHRAAPVNNPTLITIKVNASQKRVIRDELHRVDINQFTTYYDLDHLIEGDKERLELLGTNPEALRERRQIANAPACIGPQGVIDIVCPTT